MALVNRDKDSSEQQIEHHVALGAVATGVTKHVAIVPFSGILTGVAYSAQGVSNAMTVALNINRFVVGAGATVIALTSAIVLVNHGTSGVVSVSLPAGGASFALQKNDVLQVVSAVANGNATDLVLTAVYKKTQDIVSYF